MKRRLLYDPVIIACVVSAGILVILGVWRTPLKANPGNDSARSATPTVSHPPVVQQHLVPEPQTQASEEHLPSQHSDTPGELCSGLTDLGLELKGTVVTGFDGYNVAIIESVGKQGVYREGDRIGGSVRLQKVFRNKAIVKLVDRDEVLVMDFQRDSAATPETMQSEPDTQPSAGDSEPSIGTNRAELLSSVEDVQGLMKSARIHPQGKGNESAGFLVSSIKPGSLLAKMGLRNGDTIIGVNGEPVTSVQQATDFYKSLVEGKKIVLEIRRRGQKETVKLKIE